MLSHTFIHAFVAAADKNHSLQASKLFRFSLLETPALSGEQNHSLLCSGRKTLPAALDLKAFNAFKDRFRLQNHAFTAAERAVIHCAVPVVGKSSQIVDFDLRQASLA